MALFQHPSGIHFGSPNGICNRLNSIFSDTEAFNIMEPTMAQAVGLFVPQSDQLLSSFSLWDPFKVGNLPYIELKGYKVLLCVECVPARTQKGLPGVVLPFYYRLWKMHHFVI